MKKYSVNFQIEFLPKDVKTMESLLKIGQIGQLMGKHKANYHKIEFYFKGESQIGDYIVGFENRGDLIMYLTDLLDIHDKITIDYNSIPELDSDTTIIYPVS